MRFLRRLLCRLLGHEKVRGSAEDVTVAARLYRLDGSVDEGRELPARVYRTTCSRCGSDLGVDIVVDVSDPSGGL